MSVSMENITPSRYRSNGSIVPLIREQGRSVAWLSRKIGLSRQFTSDVVHGHIDTRPAVADAIATALEVDSLFLLFDASESAASVTMERVA